VQLGIISLGRPNCSLASPEIMARVERVSPWVTSWINAVEAGAPAPPVAAPPPIRLPRLTFRAAGYLINVALTGTFGNRWSRGKSKDARCERIGREKIKCNIFWYYDRRVYTGGITIYFSLPREGEIWNYTFRIKRYNAYCWVYSPSLRRCRSVLFYR